MPEQPPHDDKKTPRRAKRKITTREIPKLLEIIACGDPKAQKEVLELLCPCRNPRYDIAVWRTIFRARKEDPSGEVRDQAGHAIGTLSERARTDPRSQDLIRRLEEEGLAEQGLIDAVPVWQPSLRGNGLYIPRFEHSPRSRANRRR